jgi:2-methylisocitrate lyase-like PEP mutase family enzyme
MSKREKIQEILEQFYRDYNVAPYDSQCFIEELAERGYQVVKIRKHAPRTALKVIENFLKVMYSEEDDGTTSFYLAGIDEDILLDDLQDAGYQIVKTGEGENKWHNSVNQHRPEKY